MAAPIEDVVLHQPDAHNSPIDLDLNKFMGTWHVVKSTLPLWKSRKDVTITYALKSSPSNGATVQFDDTVEYRSKSDPASSRRSRVTGVDTLVEPSEANASAAAAADTTASESGAPSRPAQTRFKWRGKGWLAVATSRWQVLGCSRDPSPENPHAWAVTYFEKTLFTPAGLDVYARTAEGLPEAFVQEIIAKARALGGDVAKLAEAFFEVERSAAGGAGSAKGA
ncbi:hypothetical protein C8Q79DRAFT_964333 [Trametes meyenii]|nr:hypothetical protein C8Q79DRAFT_964333 [Trametes meyenii]